MKYKVKCCPKSAKNVVFSLKYKPKSGTVACASTIAVSQPIEKQIKCVCVLFHLNVEFAQGFRQ